MIDEFRAVGRYLDLDEVPFTRDLSRLLVFRDGDGITVLAAEYERPARSCMVLRHLRILGAEGEPLAPTAAYPDRIEFGSGEVTATFAAPDALSFGSREDRPWTVELVVDRSAEVAVDRGVGLAAGPSVGLAVHRTPEPESVPGARVSVCWEPGLPSVPVASARAVGVVSVDAFGPVSDPHDPVDGVPDPVEEHGGASSGLRLLMHGAGSWVQLAVDSTGDPVPGTHADHLDAARQHGEAWFARAPRVREDLREMASICWWVLGVNTIELRRLPGSRAVVPSKLGYVALWQWDAYFIAAGLRHGAPELAREQLAIAFAFPSEDGHLPDVVHDFGVLRSSEDLPEADLENLRRIGSAAAVPDAKVPLTKPPLGAWALTKLLDAAPELERSAPGWVAEAWSAVGAGQDWWFDSADAGGGVPGYGHPYSSGLDDSPIFDHALPVVSPDLLAYLVVQDRLLADRAERAGDDDGATRLRTRAASTLGALLTMWDPAGRRFVPRAAGTAIEEDTAVGLIPVLTGSLPGDVLEGVVDALADAGRFATPWAIPTVSRSDASFSPQRMWRGPVWANVNALIVDGLRSSGRGALADRIAEQTLRLVQSAGGPGEYFDPFTGRRAARATTAFAWTAALFIDLAVSVSGRDR